ncbi:antibiotic biosynthesis monooxygenase [Kineococcus rhizosphaerae]|uniref:Quinol monooxygenase YgiN n=1 Tax=Kineococcus rhizosphaerae TaxID=559628 RepID=A0A2T0QXK5_9ACTN|nr:antibiotic biosynthesis monooxygenase [Kineococcus rhizosphaerae]PRY10767.1 quinol monooxygenase YgiN [Kineococcus rhizosphaerae]
MTTIELTTFTVRPERVEDMLAARPAMLADFAADRRGFVSARLVRLDATQWVDVVEWADRAAWDESREKGGNTPGIAAFFATLDELVDVRGGDVSG